MERVQIEGGREVIGKSESGYSLLRNPLSRNINPRNNPVNLVRRRERGWGVSVSGVSRNSLMIKGLGVIYQVTNRCPTLNYVKIDFFVARYYIIVSM